jgi:hypothetical protein
VTKGIVGEVRKRKVPTDYRITEEKEINHLEFICLGPELEDYMRHLRSEIWIHFQALLENAPERNVHSRW